ncbi:methyl-accepting chemotaxis protein [Geofilum rhodophaeum]|uniref:methyl-accepting chemotaxis protein n=1 Tax=Geofilum rhodophaeum TaxID=1965019 RepID=UPI000B526642|nr:methyl-accepting chemotaxis protein [Geofilum rhodophaeum]
MNWNSLPIKSKLSYSFSALTALFTIGGLLIMTTLININQSAGEMHNSHLPALTRINNLASTWQQALFYLRSYTQHKNPEYFLKAQEMLDQTEYWSKLQLQKGGPETRSLSDSINQALHNFRTKSQLVEKAIEGIDQNYNKLDSAINNLRTYSDNYLQLQYQKLKNDVDKQEPDHIIKRRADKIELMSQIVATATQLKTSIGEANFKHNYALLDSLPASLNVVKNNLAVLRPITTKRYDLDAMVAIEELADICRSAINQVINSYNTSSRLTDHNNNQQDLALVHQLRNITEQQVLNQAASYQKQTQRAQFIWWIIILLVGGTGAILALRLSASLSKPLINLAKISAYQEQGFFPRFERLARKDEIGTLTNIMQSGQEKTRNLVESLQNIASTIDRLINQLHLRSVKLDKASSTQSNNAQYIANNLNAIAQLSETNARNAAKGVVEIKKASSVVATYTQQTKHSLATLQNLMNHSDNIAHLAQQSYILSLNASVEAARDNSSLQSKGFAVIAQNMRVLAENVRDLSQQMSKLSAQGRESSNSTLNQAEEVQLSIQKAIALFSDLSEGAQGQNQAVNNIMNAAKEFNHYSSANTGIATEMAGEAAQLGQLSRQLYQLLEFYRTDDIIVTETPHLNKVL